MKSFCVKSILGFSLLVFFICGTSSLVQADQETIPYERVERNGNVIEKGFLKAVEPTLEGTKVEKHDGEPQEAGTSTHHYAKYKFPSTNFFSDPTVWVDTGTANNQGKSPENYSWACFISAAKKGWIEKIIFLNDSVYGVDKQGKRYWPTSGDICALLAENTKPAKFIDESTLPKAKATEKNHE